METVLEELKAAFRLPTEEAVDVVNAILWRMYADSLDSGRVMSRKESQAYAFFILWQGFKLAGVPFHEYQQVARAALDFLHGFIQGTAQNYESAPGFAEFWDLRQETMKRLENDPRYRDGFRDLQGR